MAVNWGSAADSTGSGPTVLSELRQALDATSSSLERFGLVVGPPMGSWQPTDEKPSKYDRSGAVKMWPKTKATAKRPRAFVQCNQVHRVKPVRRDRKR